MLEDVMHRSGLLSVRRYLDRLSGAGRRKNLSDVASTADRVQTAANVLALEACVLVG